MGQETFHSNHHTYSNLMSNRRRGRGGRGGWGGGEGRRGSRGGGERRGGGRGREIGGEGKGGREKRMKMAVFQKYQNNTIFIQSKSLEHLCGVFCHSTENTQGVHGTVPSVKQEPADG